MTEKTQKGKGFTLELVSGNGQKEIPKSNDITLETDILLMKMRLVLEGEIQ